MVTYEEIIKNNADFADKITPLLSSGRPTGYDIVVLTNSWQLTQLVKSGWLIPLDHSQLGNFTTYASPLVKSPAYDPGNKYTVAWQSGFTGIAYDPSKTERDHEHPRPVGSRLQGPGRDDDRPERLRERRAALRRRRRHATRRTTTGGRPARRSRQQKDAGIVRRYYDQRYIDALERGDIWISQAWSGDVFQARASGYPNLEFVVPQEGVCTGRTT